MAFASRHALAMATTVSGWVVVPQAGGLANAAFGLITTKSPFFTNFEIPPNAANAAATIFAGSLPDTSTMSGSLPAAKTRLYFKAAAAAIDPLTKLRREMTFMPRFLVGDDRTRGGC